jgi:hypothetical protein
MLVKRDEQTVGYFENIIIEVDGLEEIKAYLIKYTPSEPIAYVEAHDSYKFEGTMDGYQYPTCLACLEDPVDPNDPSGGTSSGGAISCINVLKCIYGGHEHNAGPRCESTYSGM